MNLPFSLEQFLRVFADYNTSVWPAQLVLNLLGVGAVLLAFRKGPTPQIIAGILSFLWAWTGLAYHLAFFASINKAAYGFGVLCLAESGLFLWFGVVRRRLSFRASASLRGVTGWVFILYALAIYPAIGYSLGHVYPAAPTFGAPCPTTIFTFGLLLWSVGKVPWALLTIPALWSLVGSSAAFSLGIREDLGLLLAGIVGSILLLRPPLTAAHPIS